MSIILPPLSKNRSVPVSSWDEIKDDAKKMIQMIESDDFAGKHKAAIALAHCQISDTPFRFFVLHSKYAKIFDLPVVIVNPKITYRKIPCKFQEGCMSFPNHEQKRTSRFLEIGADYQSFSSILKKMEYWEGDFRALEAFVFQHEIDHMNGINIYGTT